MLSDRVLRRGFGLSAAAVALWGPPIRGFAALATFLVLAGLAGVYARTARSTIEIRQGQDFGVFYESALARQRGDVPVNRDLLAGDGDLPPPNLNPPHFDYVILPLTRMALPAAFGWWLGISALGLIASLALVVRCVGVKGWSVFWLCAAVFSAPPMVAQLFTGQVGLVLLVPFTVAWACARQHRQIASGVWMGVCASIKPFFLLFAAYFVARRWPRAAAASVATVALVVGIGLALNGADAYREWMRDLLSVTWAEHYMNASVLGFVERVLSDSEWHQVPIVHWPWLVAPLYGAAFIGGAVITLRRAPRIPSIDKQLLLVTAAALLLSPLGWVYYLWFLIPPLVATLHEWESMGAVERRVMIAALVGCLVPPFVAISALSWSGGTGTATVGSIYFWALSAVWISAMQMGERSLRPDG